MTYECPRKRCKSVEPFAADHVCYRLDVKGAGYAVKSGAAPAVDETLEMPERVVVFVATDQGAIDTQYEVVRLADLGIGCPLPLLMNHQPELRIGTVESLTVQPAEGGPFLLGIAEVGFGAMEDTAWEGLLAGRFRGVSVGMVRPRHQGAIVESGVLTEVSLASPGKAGSCPTAQVLAAGDKTALTPDFLAAATKAWQAWRLTVLAPRLAQLAHLREGGK
jgi:hypothetical protein